MKNSNFGNRIIELITNFFSLSRSILRFPLLSAGIFIASSVIAYHALAENYVLVYDATTSAAEESEVMESYKNITQRLGLDYQIVFLRNLSDIAEFTIKRGSNNQIVGFIIAAHGLERVAISISGQEFGLEDDSLDADQFSDILGDLIEKQTSHLAKNFFIHLNSCTLAGTCFRQRPGFLERFATLFMPRFPGHEISITGFNFSTSLATVDNATARELSKAIWGETRGIKDWSKALVAIRLKFQIVATNPKVYDFLSRIPIVNKLFSWNANLTRFTSLKLAFWSGLGLWVSGHHELAVIAPIMAFIVHKLMAIPVSGRGTLISGFGQPQTKDVDHIGRILSRVLSAEAPSETSCKEVLMGEAKPSRQKN